jgi:hypothetical protein
MKKILVFAMAVSFGLFLMPLTIYAQSGQTAATPPPVAPTLVREGDFATELVTELNLGTTENEAEAESILTASGIAPRNGWISDYPVTPDIVAELHQAVWDAAEANRLPMGKGAALKALQNVEASFDIAVVPDTSGKYAEGVAPTDNTYTEPSAVDDYYSEEGPPVVTYYPPPPDYGYLYAWVPSPFWSGGLFFPGFFVLSDFDVVVVSGHHHHHHHHHHGEGVISNHVRDPRNRTVARIDPVTRTPKRFNAGSASMRGFSTPEGKRGASAISERSGERSRMSNAGSSAVSGRSGEVTRGRNMTSPGTGQEHWNSPSIRSGNPGTSGGRGVRNPRMSGGPGMSGRSFSPPVQTRGFNSGDSHSYAHGGSFGGIHGGGGRRL